MGICLSHISALEFWRTLQQSAVANIVRARSSKEGFLTSCSPSNEDLSKATTLPNLSSPVHLLVPNSQARRRIQSVVCHVAPQKLSDKAFVCVSENLFVCSPELCFVQMAALLSLAKLIALGCELCGSYRTIPEEATRYNMPPLTSRKALAAFLDECDYLPAVKKARRALRFISNDSASPMETVLILLLCLPMNLGGYALPYPQQNYRIDFPKQLKSMCSKSYYVCDLYWPEARLAIEYDSDLSHVNSASITHDASKRNELSYLDITVVTVTRTHVLSWAHMDRIASLIAKRLKKRRRSYDDFSRKQYELRRELLDFHKTR